MTGRELLDRLGVELPVVQAGMGGGLARAELAAAVSEAGGLGTIGILDAAALASDVRAARERTSKPIAVNLLLPFARRGHFEAARAADVLVTFWGRPRRAGDGVWMHQCGSVAEAREAREAGADGAIVQGVEAGGHVRGTTPALELLAATRAALGPDFPLLLAGGIAEGADVQAALDAGATAAVAGTRFLMTAESGAHPVYKQRLVEARETVLTELFGAGWAGAPHRVLRNRATERWLGHDRRGPVALRLLQLASAPLLARVPMSQQDRLARLQRPGAPLLSPVAPTAGSPLTLIESGPLYAGETVARIDDVRPAAELVRELAGLARFG